MGFILFPFPKTISTFHHLKWLWSNLLQSNYDIYRFYVALFFLKSLFLLFCKSMISLYISCYLDLSFFPFAKVWYLYTTLCYFNLSFFPFAKVWYLYTTLLLFGSLFFPLCKNMISLYRSHVIWNPLFSLCKSMISIQLLFFDSLKKISFDKYGIYE